MDPDPGSIQNYIHPYNYYYIMLGSTSAVAINCSLIHHMSPDLLFNLHVTPETFLSHPPPHPHSCLRIENSQKNQGGRKGGGRPTYRPKKGLSVYKTSALSIREGLKSHDCQCTIKKHARMCSSSRKSKYFSSLNLHHIFNLCIIKKLVR